MGGTRHTRQERVMHAERRVSLHIALSVTFGDSSPRGGAKASGEGGW